MRAEHNESNLRSLLWQYQEIARQTRVKIHAVPITLKNLKWFLRAAIAKVPVYRIGFVPTAAFMQDAQ